MDEAFACPECGNEIRLTGLSPGREVRCGWCRTWVSVPYMPRAEQVKRRRRGRGERLLPVWAWAGLAVLAAAILMAGTRRAVLARRQRAEIRAMANLVEKSRRDEALGRLGVALAEMEGALAQAEALKPAPPDLDALRTRRDRLSRREAESQLAALDAGAPAEDPARSVGRALTLLTRVQNDPALDGLEPRARETLGRLRLRRTRGESRAAEAALAAGRFDDALAHCQRQYTTADDLAPVDRTLWQGRATDLARRLISGHGVVVEPVRGQFALGNPVAYAGLLRPVVTPALLRAGYLPRPPEPLWDELWATVSPYRIRYEVRERQEGLYLESQNRVSALELTVTLSRHGEDAWFCRPQGRTQVPVPGLPAYLATRVQVADRRSPEAERLLYENARTNLLHQLGSNLRRLPACTKDEGMTDDR